MAIRMQGNWTVSVKSKSAAFAQRFLIEGATSGDGTYNGVTSTPPVYVAGTDWTIRIQYNSGTGWKDSADRITFPSVSGGQDHFTIESNDGGSDTDFNDLILECSMPVTLTDFLLYGSVSLYRPGCVFNPCRLPLFAVIDSRATLVEAARYPAIRDVLKKVAPERLKPHPPLPDPPPLFKPIVFALQGDTAIPPKENLVLHVVATEAKPARKAAEAAAPSITIASIDRKATFGPGAAIGIDTAGIGALAGQLARRCHAEPLPGVVLHFQEYDRTGAELTGGPYTGEGLREDLGTTVTDGNGNFIFRFSRTIADFLDEAAVDTAVGESTVTQSAPDIIVQLIDVMEPGTVLWESAPYFNVGTRKRINLCVPEGRIPTGRCLHGQVIQSLGNIYVGPATGVRPPWQPVGWGDRVGLGNALGKDGRITARSSTAPANVRCACWGGRVDLFACFLDYGGVERYTIRYRVGGSAAPWFFFTQALKHPEIALAGLPGYDGTLVGPHSHPLHVDGAVTAVSVPTYLNIEENPAYVSTHRDRRAQISTWALGVATPAPVQFWIEGYDAAGHRVAGAEDSVVLYIDNTWPFLDIDDNVTMAGTTLGNCAKFKLPAGQPAAPLTVKFKVDQPQGFLDSYWLFMYKGAAGSFGIVRVPAPPDPDPGPYLQRSYVHGDDLACSSFRGTFDDPNRDPVTGYVTVDVAPAAGGWLEPGQNFCAFSVNLDATVRRTDGYCAGVTDPVPATPVLIGIEA